MTILHPFKMDWVRASLEHEREKRQPKNNRSEAAITRTGVDLAVASSKVSARNNNFDQRTALNLYRKYYRLTVKA